MSHKTRKFSISGGATLLSIALFYPLSLFGQETNSHVSGIVKSEDNEVLFNATVIAVHEPTKNTYSTKANETGYFYFFNVRPGGPYSITISHTGFQKLIVKNLFLSYSTPNFYANGDELSAFVLHKNDMLMPEVIVSAIPVPQKFGIETNIDKNKIRSLPSVSRNLQDFVRLVPQAKVNGEGMISLAGQNNKFNAFFIDGSNINDMLGLSVGGTAGGQTGSPPISIEAIEELNVSLSPFDVQYSNFTGGNINAITRSGSNEFKSSAWYFFRNEKLAGKSPVPVAKPGSPGVFERSRLSDFFNQTTGVWISGAFVENRLFYFFLTEIQDEAQPQSYFFSDYRGNSSMNQINALADTVQKRFGYDPGTFLETSNELLAKRFTAKLDWNADNNNKLTVSYRYNKAERVTPQLQNSGSIIRFSNNRFSLISKINSASLEWKRYFKGSANNRLLIAYNNELTDRQVVGQPFPVVSIMDGAAIITLGSNANAQLNVLKASEFNLSDIFRVSKGRQVFSAGAEVNFSRIKDVAIGNYFGQYVYKNPADFIDNEFAIRYFRNASSVDKPVNDETKAGARFNTMRLGAFINDEIRVNKHLTFTFGLRVDGNSLPLEYKEDVFFNTVAKPEIEKYYDLKGAISGRSMKTHWQLAPRWGFQYKIPAENIIVRGGAGMFTGHILNLWASELYFANTYSIDIVPQLYGLRFNSDPYHQPDQESLGIDPESSKGSIVLVAKDYKYPTAFRAVLGIDRRFKSDWLLTTELLFTKNIHEHRYTNVNLLPPSKMTPLPDRRNVYSLGVNPVRIPLPGGNPYSDVFLLSNNNSKKGFSYSFTVAINRFLSNNLFVSSAYSYGNSMALFDPAGNANGSEQWRQTETVNGKNFATRSVSDFDPGHRVFAALSKKVSYRNCSTMVSLFYNGQSGTAFSYVYNGTMVNDSRLINFDLVYIPTPRDLETMIFLPNTVAGITYTPQQQKQALDEFISNDKYLRKHRGEFAGRNEARLPFTHVVDLRLQQDLKLKAFKKDLMLSIIYDVFNFTNMLNKNWGRTYFLTSDNFQLIRFAGFSNATTLTPQYQFNPVTGDPWSVQSSTAPGSSARWISQLGIKIKFN